MKVRKTDVVTNLAQAREIPAVSGHHVAYVQHPGCGSSSSYSNPNIFLSGRIPCSPYRLTWISPSSLDPRVVRSDPNIVGTSLPVHYHNPNSLTSSYSQSASWARSPYFPNNNTPISSDSGLNQVGLPPTNAVINRANNVYETEQVKTEQIADKPQKENRKRIEDASKEGTKELASRGQQNGAEQGCHCNSCNSILWSYVAAQCTAESAGGQTSANARCLQRERYVRELESNLGCQQCLTYLRMDNNSISPNVGSASTSHYNQPADYYNNGVSLYNSSVCGQVDSYEMMQFGSNTTGMQSYSVSGYNAGRSHSTSVGGHISCLMPRDNSRQHNDRKIEVPDLSEVAVVTTTAASSNLVSGLTESVAAGNDSENGSSAGSATTNGSSQQLSTTVHSTRSAPAAIGVHNATSWTDSNINSNTTSWTDSQTHNNTARSLSTRTAPVVRSINHIPLPVQLIQCPGRLSVQAVHLPTVLEDGILSQMAPTQSTPPLSGCTPERHVCHMAVDVPLAQAGLQQEAGDWDYLPFYAPVSIASTGNSVHTTPDSLTEYGPHLHLMYTAQPLLRDAQYWV